MAVAALGQGACVHQFAATVEIHRTAMIIIIIENQAAAGADGRLLVHGQLESTTIGPLVESGTQSILP